MHVRFFTISVHGGEEAAEELNRFLAAHRVVAIDRELVHDGANSAWAVSVTVVQAESRPQIPKKAAIDYKDVLSETDFAIYAKLRSLRKALADQEGVPSYALFTNEQLAEMVRRRVTTASGLREIHGVGDARVKKYGNAFLEITRAQIGPGIPPNGGDDREA
jgi:superfamily II DNA helicase RecQ